MARVTVEDCLEKLGNHFRLVLVANHRARQLLAGREPLVERGEDKATVISLREIAEGAVNESILEEPVEQKDLVAEEELKGLLAESLNESGPGEEDVFSNVDIVETVASEQKAVAESEDNDEDAPAAADEIDAEDDDISLDDLQSAEQNVDEDLETAAMQVDDYDPAVAETVEDMEQRADLDLDQIIADEDEVADADGVDDVAEDAEGTS